MRRPLSRLVAVLLLCPFWISLVPKAAAEPLPPVGRWVQTTVADWVSGVLDGTVVSSAGDGELRLVEGRSEGTYTSVERVTSIPFRGIGLLYRARVPTGSSLSFAVRARSVSGEWSRWIELGVGPWMDPEGRAAGEALAVVPTESDTLQYRVTFRAEGGSVPALEEIVLVYLPAQEGPALRANPPWEEPGGKPHPVPPADWGGRPASEGSASIAAAPLRVEVRPAALTTAGAVRTSTALQLVQRFQQDVLAFPDLAYGYFVDAQGIVYEGRGAAVGDTLYVGVVGGTPEEPVPPTAEDALVALLDGWVEQLGNQEWRIATPDDTALGERLRERLEAEALRQNRWLFVRGATAPAEHEWLLLSNASSRRSTVTWELFPDATQRMRGAVSVPARSRASLFLNRVLPKGDFWTVVSPASELIAERALYYGPDADASAGLDLLSRDWYLPGGSQENGFTTTIWLLNPQVDRIPVTVTVFSPDGPAARDAFTLAGGARLKLPLSQVYTGSTVVGCRVQARAPVAAEQAVRFATGGYGMPGTPILSRSWTVPGVETEAPFWTVLAFLNPHESPVGITLTLMTSDGTSLRRSYLLRPGEQRLNLNTILPRLSLAAQVEAAQPIAVARVTFFNEFRAAHAVLGAPRPARRWYLAEGATAEPFEAWLALANPNDQPAEGTVTLLGARGELRSDRFRMPAHSRFTVLLNELAPAISALAVEVESDRPVVVERAMYLHGREGGHAGLGIPR